MTDSEAVRAHYEALTRHRVDGETFVRMANGSTIRGVRATGIVHDEVYLEFVDPQDHVVDAVRYEAMMRDVDEIRDCGVPRSMMFAGTETRRFLSHEVNIQALPRSEEDG